MLIALPTELRDPVHIIRHTANSIKVKTQKPRTSSSEGILTGIFISYLLTTFTLENQ